MAKKKSSKKSAAPKDFANSPFKSLKGLSAFETQPEPEKPVKKSVVPEGREEQSSFADEMGFLGVEPLSGRNIEKIDGQEKPVPAPRKKREESDEATFLEALGSMETVFKDEWPEEDGGKPASARRMKQVEKGEFVPDAELDLHGLTVDAATEKVDFFLQNAIHRGDRTVLLITGKGLHSAEGPVLRAAVENLLRHNQKQVVEFVVAPRRYGGDGALVVFLRSKPSL